MTVDIWNLTAHQLDVIRTGASVLGAIGGFVGGVGAVGAFLSRYWAKQAALQTRREEWADGTLHTMDVAELAARAMHATQEVRQEVTDFYNDPPAPKDHGRRRLPTTDIPLLKESTYE